MSAQEELNKFLENKQAVLDSIIDEYNVSKTDTDSAYMLRLEEIQSVADKAQRELEAQHVKLQEAADAEIQKQIVAEQASSQSSAKPRKKSR